MSAQEIRSNAAQATATKKGSGINKLNGGKQTENGQKTNQAESQAPTCNQVSPCFVITEPKAKTKEEQTKADSLDTLTRRYMWATIIGVIGGLIGIGILIWQTNLVRISAQAALLNAQAVIDSERAWLIPAAEAIKPNELPTVGSANAQVETFAVRIENCGRTPAWLMDWFVGAVILDDTNIGQLTNAGRPEGDFPNARPFPQGRIEDFSFEWTTSWPQINYVKSGQKQLYIYGYLQYRSLTRNEPRISRFCFHYFHRRNNIGGFDEGWTIEPPEENFYT